MLLLLSCLCCLLLPASLWLLSPPLVVLLSSGVFLGLYVCRALSSLFSVFFLSASQRLRSQGGGQCPDLHSEWVLSLWPGFVLLSVLEWNLSEMTHSDHSTCTKFVPGCVCVHRRCLQSTAHALRRVLEAVNRCSCTLYWCHCVGPSAVPKELFFCPLFRWNLPWQWIVLCLGLCWWCLPSSQRIPPSVPQCKSRYEVRKPGWSLWSPVLLLLRFLLSSPR